MSPSAFEDACKNEHIKGIYVVPDYHNPTACCMPVENRKEIAAIAKKYNQIIIEDATYNLHHKKHIRQLPLLRLNRPFMLPVYQSP